ncbi:ABC transporter substrate-binding protein [Paenibacillus sp. J2TS4]|uniref:ABC transporter substrate-binding protein n=1 Tax=Paenibacillus sp. J2TS4 TaxID=2807194 RepID=UPI001BD0A5D1|nr:iron-siderophore ABC transporter substrate-binding protein [Paenibacillus sp. J2TS4]
MRHNKLSLVLIILSLMLVLAACGGNSGPAPAASPSAPEGEQKASQEIRTVQHALGNTDIKGIPQRVVALEWTYAEDVLALGIQPVGIADIANMKKWVRLPVEIAPEVVDVGERIAPNLESIMALKPDLIIGLKRNVEANYAELDKIAPTLVYEPYPQEGQGDQYSEMIDTFKAIADVLGKNDEAEQVLKDLNQSYEESKAKIAAAGMDKVPFVLAMAYSNQNSVDFRLSTDNSMAVKILEHIGLTNAYKAKQFEIYGFTLTDVEALPALQDANFLHIIQETDNVIENQLKNNPVWNGLNFVKENRVYALGGDMWPYGGPLSAQIMAEKTADLLTK